jgi:hypothetical protein
MVLKVLLFAYLLSWGKMLFQISKLFVFEIARNFKIVEHYSFSKYEPKTTSKFRIHGGAPNSNHQCAKIPLLSTFNGSRRMTPIPFSTKQPASGNITEIHVAYRHAAGLNASSSPSWESETTSLNLLDPQTLLKTPLPSINPLDSIYNSDLLLNARSTQAPQISKPHPSINPPDTN